MPRRFSARSTPPLPRIGILLVATLVLSSLGCNDGVSEFYAIAPESATLTALRGVWFSETVDLRCSQAVRLSAEEDYVPVFCDRAASTVSVSSSTFDFIWGDCQPRLRTGAEPPQVWSGVLDRAGDGYEGIVDIEWEGLDAPLQVYMRLPAISPKTSEQCSDEG